jgi:FHA domain
VTEPVLWALLVLFVIASAPYALWILRNRINEPLLGHHLAKLLRAGDVERAKKLTQAADVAVTHAIRAAIEATSDAALLVGGADDYRRSAASNDPALVLDALRSRFVAAFDARRKPLLVRRVAAVVCALGLVALAVQSSGSHATLSIAALALLALLALALVARVDALSRARALGLFDKLSPELYERAVNPAAPLLPAPPKLTLIVTEPGQPPRVESIVDEIVKIGRGPSALVRIDDERVAVLHAVIEHTEDAVKIIDLGSDQGTLVNGEPVNQSELRDGDEVRIGAASIVVRLPR